MLYTHVSKSGKTSQKPRTNETQQRSHIHLGLLLGETDAQLGAHGRQTRVNVTHNMGEELVQGLKDELDKASLCGAMRGFLGEFPCARVEVNVAPETASKLGNVNSAVRIVVQGSK